MIRSVPYGVLHASLAAAACAPDGRVQQLLDRQRVLDTVDELSIQTDNRNWAAVGNVFADPSCLR